MYMLKEHAKGSSASYDGGDVVFDKFESFRCSYECIRLMMASQPIAPISAAPNAVMTSTQSELAAFKKGIRHDTALYPILTQDTQWDLWNCSVISLERVQSVEQVLDDKYIPVLPDKVALFYKKNKYLYAVFEQTLHSDKDKAIVQAYEDTFDTQKVYKEMYDYCNHSTSTQLTSLVLCCHTLPLFVSAMAHGSQVLISSFFSGKNRCAYAANAVHAVPELRQAKIQTDQLATQTGRQLSYVE
jgi:hypothetical protein